MEKIIKALQKRNRKQYLYFIKKVIALMKEKNQLQNEFEQKNEAMQKKIHSLIEENSELKGINERDCENHIDLIMKYNTLSEIYKELEERNEALLKENSELKSINETKLINMLYKNYSDIQEYNYNINKNSKIKEYKDIFEEAGKIYKGTKIAEKALKLAKYNGWQQINSYSNLKEYKHLSTNKLKTQKDLIEIYSSFDKLMELFVNINTNQILSYWAEIDSNKVSLFDEYVNEETFFYGQKSDDNILQQFKEALIDCLLKYFEITTGE